MFRVFMERYLCFKKSLAISFFWQKKRKDLEKLSNLDPGKKYFCLQLDPELWPITKKNCISYSFFQAQNLQYRYGTSL